LLASVIEISPLPLDATTELNPHLLELILDDMLSDPEGIVIPADMHADDRTIFIAPT
jgi:hypothetical protein